MKVRIIIGVIAVCVFLPVLIFSHTVVYPIAMAILSAMGVFEMLTCTRLIRKRIFSVISLLFALSAPFAAYYGGFSSLMLTTALYALLCVMYAVLFQLTEILNRLYSTLFIIAYICLGFSSLIILRSMTGGIYVAILVYMVAWLTDTFAYFTGSLFGRNKLIPKLSPKKTYEGAIGGIVLTLLFCACYIIGVDLFADGVTPNYLLLLLGVLTTSAMSQIGDLAMSQVKRYYNVKDYGKIMPGHGGILDRFDSVIAVSLTFTLIIFAFTNIKLF